MSARCARSPTRSARRRSASRPIGRASVRATTNAPTSASRNTTAPILSARAIAVARGLVDGDAIEIADAHGRRRATSDAVRTTTARLDDALAAMRADARPRTSRRAGPAPRVTTAASPRGERALGHVERDDVGDRTAAMSSARRRRSDALLAALIAVDDDVDDLRVVARSSCRIATLFAICFQLASSTSFIVARLSSVARASARPRVPPRAAFARSVVAHCHTTSATVATIERAPSAARAACRSSRQLHGGTTSIDSTIVIQCRSGSPS